MWCSDSGQKTRTSTGSVKKYLRARSAQSQRVARTSKVSWRGGLLSVGHGRRLAGGCAYLPYPASSCGASSAAGERAFWCASPLVKAHKEELVVVCLSVWRRLPFKSLRK